MKNISVIGVCSCIGSSHCQSFDEAWLQFEGVCQYTLARDNCANGVPAGKPSWEVFASFELVDRVSRPRQIYVHLNKEDLVSTCTDTFLLVFLCSTPRLWN